MLEIGSIVDRKYKILQKIGQGGMSVVYMALNESANKTWAIKEVRKDGTQDFDVVKQGLIVETDMLKRLDHPHLPSIIDVIEGDGSFLIVMDYIEGKTLKKLLDEQGAQPQDCVIDWAKQLCDVLGYLHSRRPPIIYRDMKPSNVMLKPDGNIVLFDFGTAREYKGMGGDDTTCLGTRGYAAPEQYGGQGETDARTDIYCLGATMYHLLTGHNPSDPPYETYPIREWNPALSAGLEEIILKCMQKNPFDRYQNCAELMYALDNYDIIDVAYRKKQVRKLKFFMIPAVMSVVFGIGSATCYGMEQHTTNSNYSAYLAAAHNSTIKSDEIKNYEKAINLNPSEGEAYMELLQEGFLDDNVFTRDESERLRNILIHNGSDNRTNETKLRNNAEAYDRFAYEAGIAYYYKYEDNNSKKNAKAYFEAAASSVYLDSRQVERAKRLYAICDYYSQIGIADQTGDASVTYRNYWNDLTELSSGNLVEIDNERTALIVYQEQVTQMVSRCVEFMRDGITSDDMNAQLNNIEQHLQTDFGNVSDGNRAAINDEIAKLRENISRARNIIQSTTVMTGQGE